ncbi:uncharacterized protein K452DRAFT_42052 [Aplosporella prunicola CBS 121167]|uniref:Uncharacterized protein n=1 Tax=Aplosporella prunicola CBS 121167 TaxID=1176127 RepID=A0A6A6BEH1_9PEZI|nr:uncharacterized protein K452DRAFT_42052 [Aplosporella prunicola CBS 121167]KAF2140871.1 hypothetical protein K452DRAFT_42052 [Aplosporella prunicola CBS 121167]
MKALSRGRRHNVVGRSWSGVRVCVCVCGATWYIMPVVCQLHTSVPFPACFLCVYH